MREMNGACGIDNVRSRDWKFVGFLTIAEGEVVLEGVLRELIEVLADPEDDGNAAQAIVDFLAEKRLV